MSLEEKILQAKKMGSGAWGDRICAELGYAAAVSAANGHAYDELVESAADALLGSAKKDGNVVTKDTACAAEQLLMPMAALAKSYRVHCISHAHIDMNWMWGFQETAAVTVDTFRTVLDLMKEYPTLTFGQSQASTYQIIEEYAPEMLEEIKERIREGRWEVTASTWVETDKNMPNGESLSRHILYTKRYLSKLLDIPAETLALDFEPDTFGHNISVPEICQKGGIRYYYHCRGNHSDEFIYRWRARSRAELLVWREPEWYNYTIDPDMFRKVPGLCARYGIRDFLSVYGVGDHGGGPTRRDVERLIEMSAWPIMPTLMFSTYGAFYGALEKNREAFPVIEGELNFIFTGCYTSQTRIKMANRMAEDRMYEAELISAASHALAGGPSCRESYGKAWEHILFNQFHDILPGSGVIDTREYALGRFQRAMAAIQTNANRSMRALAEAIDTSSIGIEATEDSISQGAGVGFATDRESHYHLPCAERGLGKKRVFHLFNSTQYEYDGVTDITVWDWNYDAGRAVFADAEGNVAAAVCTGSRQSYWGHQYKTFALRVKVPAMGWATYTLDQKDAAAYEPLVAHREHCHFDDYQDNDIVMENDKIRAVFDHGSMQLTSLVDKKSGEDLIGLPAATFRLVCENLVHGMTAWRVGDAMTVENLNETKNVVVREVSLGSLRQFVRYTLDFGQRSHLQVTVSLSEASSLLDFDIRVDFHEVCGADHIPQLNFIVPAGYAVAGYRYDVPFGDIDRPAIAHDVPANSYAAAIPAAGENHPGLMVVTDSKYGFRGVDHALAVTLIRATRDPDPYPEYGIHTMRLGMGPVDNMTHATLHRAAVQYIHPLALCSARAGKGTLPLNGQFLKVEGDVRISTVKAAEEGDGVVVRLSDQSGRGGNFQLTFAVPVMSAQETDLNENAVGDLPVAGRAVCGEVEAFGIKTVLVRF